MRNLVLISTLGLLAACASSGTVNSYSAQYDALVASCQDRGGILSPTGSQSGRPQNDYVCRITGQASGRIGN